MVLLSLAPPGLQQVFLHTPIANPNQKAAVPSATTDLWSLVISNPPRETCLDDFWTQGGQNSKNKIRPVRLHSSQLGAHARFGNLLGDNVTSHHWAKQTKVFGVWPVVSHPAASASV